MLRLRNYGRKRLNVSRRREVTRDGGTELGREALALVASRFRVLAEPVRLEILQALAHSERTVSELAATVETTAPNVSKHLRLLEEAGFVQRRPQGNSVVCALRNDTAARLCEVVCENLRGQLLAAADLFPFAAAARRPRR
jgi:DNA-binding transcriptional ArsR family regulator